MNFYEFASDAWVSWFWEHHFNGVLLGRLPPDYLHLLMAWRMDYAPHSPEEAFHPRFVEALQKQAHVEYLLDVLLFGETEEKAALITDYGKDVIQLCLLYTSRCV